MQDLGGFVIASLGVALFPIAFGKFTWAPIGLLLLGALVVFIQHRARKAQDAELETLRIQRQRTDFRGAKVPAIQAGHVDD